MPEADRRRTGSSSSKSNRDELTALQILYSKPAGKRLTYAEVRELANAISRPPRAWTTEQIWEAYEHARERPACGVTAGRCSPTWSHWFGTRSSRSTELVPWTDTVHERFQGWLSGQQERGRTFSYAQGQWLTLIRDHVAGSLTVNTDDLLDTPFTQHGGPCQGAAALRRPTRRTARGAHRSARGMTTWPERLPELPEGWAMTRLGDVGRSQLGKMLSRKSKTGVGELPYLRNQNVQWGRFVLDDLATMTFSDDERQKFALEPGDLVVCEGGEIGRASVWRGDCPMYCQKALHRVRFAEGVSPEFVLYALRFMAEFSMLTPYSSGSTIKHLPQEDSRLLPFPLPPSGEQVRIAEELSRRLSHVEAAERGLAKSGVLLRAARAAVEFAALAEARLDEVPLSEVITAEGLTNGHSVKDRPGGFPVLRLTCLRDGRRGSDAEQGRRLDRRGSSTVPRPEGRLPRGSGERITISRRPGWARRRCRRGRGVSGHADPSAC